MGVLQDSGVTTVHHYTPLHYLAFIARSRSLMCKPSLAAAGFGPSHLRSMSKEQDVARGFNPYAHLTLDRQPRILKAKLSAGFPHVALAIPAKAIEAGPYSLCRFNVAMTRFLQRDGKPGFEESATNGRYYEGHQIPIAREDADKAAMLAKHLPAGTMIEVLVPGNLALPDEVKVVTYSQEDADLAKSVLETIGAPWTVVLEPAPGPYPRSKVHAQSVGTFINQALGDLNWRGNGLEFDRLKPE
jgi:hypothetical protein